MSIASDTPKTKRRWRRCLVFAFALCVFLAAIPNVDYSDVRRSMAVSTVAWGVLLLVYIEWRRWGVVALHVALLLFSILYLSSATDADDMMYKLWDVFRSSTMVSFPIAVGRNVLVALKKTK